MKYILHFVHELLTFRWPEFLALANKHRCKFKLISPKEHLASRPYIIIEIQDEQLGRLEQASRSSYLLKGLYELWASADGSPDDLSSAVAVSFANTSRKYATADQTFRVDCESFYRKLTQSIKVDWISRMRFLDSYSCRPNLKEPKQKYCIFEIDKCAQSPTKEYYFGRLVTTGNRAVIQNFNLKDRIFIANTTMDPLISLIAANLAQVGPNDIVYDPFVGSGSLMVAAAYSGGSILGGDIDWQLLHGKSRPSRIGQKVRKEGESVKANLRQYNLEHRYIDVAISDITKSPVRRDWQFDAIISDPPYGIRERSETIGYKGSPKPVLLDKVRYPSKTSYTMDRLIGDLLSTAAVQLRIGGRLVYFLPMAINSEPYESHIPRHPCLDLISYSEQTLAGKLCRLLIVMEKRREPRREDGVTISEQIATTNLRDVYFNKG